MSTTNYVAGAMTFVAGLAWNDAIKSAMEKYIRQPDDGIYGKFAYAIIVTMLSVIIIYALSRVSSSLPLRVVNGETLEEIKKLRPSVPQIKYASPSIPTD